MFLASVLVVVSAHSPHGGEAPYAREDAAAVTAWAEGQGATVARMDTFWKGGSAPEDALAGPFAPDLLYVAAPSRVWGGRWEMLLGKTVVPVDALLARVAPGTVVALDTCAGGGRRGLSGVGGMRLAPSGVELRVPDGVAVWAAAAPEGACDVLGRTGVHTRGDGGSRFRKALLHALSGGGDADGDGVVVAAEAEASVRSQLVPYGQEPWFAGDVEGWNVPVVAATAPLPAPRPDGPPVTAEQARALEAVDARLAAAGAPALVVDGPRTGWLARWLGRYLDRAEAWAAVRRELGRIGVVGADPLGRAIRLREARLALAKGGALEIAGSPPASSLKDREGWCHLVGEHAAAAYDRGYDALDALLADAAAAGVRGPVVEEAEVLWRTRWVASGFPACDEVDHPPPDGDGTERVDARHASVDARSALDAEADALGKVVVVCPAGARDLVEAAWFVLDATHTTWARATTADARAMAGVLRRARGLVEAGCEGR